MISNTQKIKHFNKCLKPVEKKSRSDSERPDITRLINMADKREETRMSSK